MFVSTQKLTPLSWLLKVKEPVVRVGKKVLMLTRRKKIKRRKRKKKRKKIKRMRRMRRRNTELIIHHNHNLVHYQPQPCSLLSPPPLTRYRRTFSRQRRLSVLHLHTASSCI